MSSAVLEEVARENVESPPTAPPMSPLEKLRELERKSLDKGISRELFEDIRNIGDCPEQVQWRICQHEDWLAAH